MKSRHFVAIWIKKFNLSQYINFWKGYCVTLAKNENAFGLAYRIACDELNIENYDELLAELGLLPLSEGLRERLKEYYNLGARFTKWRAVYKISKDHPSQNAITTNAKSLAKYAALVQEANMVPIVEPEVLMDGNHDINRCFEVTSAVLKECFQELKNEKVKMEGIVLKPNMILNGADSGLKNEPAIVAAKTLECLKNNVPKEVPGIAFLSGGQSELEATINLNEINKINDTKLIFTFSYGRALQQGALKQWAKNIHDKKTTQSVFSHRAYMNSLAATGSWKQDKEVLS